MLTEERKRKAATFLRENEGAVYEWARKYSIPGYELEDLAQELRVAFLEKYEYFDESRGTNLLTWACYLWRTRLNHLFRAYFRTNKRTGEEFLWLDAQLGVHYLDDEEASNLFAQLDSDSEYYQVEKGILSLVLQGQKLTEARKFFGLNNREWNRILSELRTEFAFLSSAS